MEKIASHLKLAESKQRNLCKAHKELQAEASSILLLSLQWKELEEHFDSSGELIRAQYKELEEREIGISLKEKQLGDVESSIHQLSQELELKKNEMRRLTDLIEEYNAKVILKGKELESAQERLNFLSKNIELRESDLNRVCTRITDNEKELVNKEKRLDLLKKGIEECEEEFGLKEQKLNGMMKLIEELSIECDLKENHVGSIRTLLQEHEEELATNEKKHDAIKMAIRESSMVLKLKEKELESIQNMIATKWKEKRLDFIEKKIKLRVGELNVKEQELGSVQSKLKDLSMHLVVKESELEAIIECIEEHSKELDLQENELDGCRKSLQDCQNQLIPLTEYVCSIEKAIIECSKELELEENHLISNSFDDHSNELPLVDKQNNSISSRVHKCLEGLKAKKKHFNLLRISIEERSRKLQIEERDFERRTEELNKKNEDLNKKKEELKLMPEKCSTILEEFEIIKKDLVSQKKFLDEHHREVRLKERQYPVLGKKFELVEKDIDLDPTRDSMGKCPEEERLEENQNIPNLKIKTEESDCIPAYSSNSLLDLPSGMTFDGNFLLFSLCEHLKVHDLVRNRLAIALQTSPHPAKLVLDAMRWFYPPPMMTDDIKFDVNNIKRGCILLAELMFKTSPQITSPLKEEALKLAAQWKVKLIVTSENHLDILGFLLLLANYGLASSFCVDELRILLNSISHYKQAVGLGQALRIVDKSPVGNTSHSLVQLEQGQSLPTNKTLISSFKNEPFSLVLDERKLLLLLNEQLTGHDLVPIEILSTLQRSTDPAKLVLDVIRGSFNQKLEKEMISFESSFILLEKLMEISPQICLKVKEDAMSLAVDWKSKIRIDSNSSLEAVAFLHLLVSYELTSSFREDEILKLFENTMDYEQVAELLAMFGFIQKLHDFIRNLIGMERFTNAAKFINKYRLGSFRPLEILNRYLQAARDATIKTSKEKEASHGKDDAMDKEVYVHSPEIASQSLENLFLSLKGVKTNKGSSEPTNGLQNMDKIIHNNSQQPHIMITEVQQPHPVKVEKQQPDQTSFGSQRPTNVEFRQPHPSKIHQPYQTSFGLQRPTNVEFQQLHPSKIHQPHQTSFGLQQSTNVEFQQPCPSKIHQPHSSKNEEQPHLLKIKAHQPHLSRIEAQQPRPSMIEAHHQQPRPSIIEAQHPRLANLEQQQQCLNKRKIMQPQPDQMKCPRTSSSIRSNDFPDFSQRFVGMHGPFGVQDYGYGFTQHNGNPHLNPWWRKP